jgi:predicted acyltransferase
VWQTVKNVEFAWDSSQTAWVIIDSQASSADSAATGSSKPAKSPRQPAASGNEARRLVSLDVLRGLTVAFMILVNNAGDGSASFAQLRHSAWNGCTLTDLVFPLFLFIMGVSMTLSFEGRLTKGTAKSRIALQAAKRAALIFLLGLTLNALPFFHLGTLRYCGVLQRIGICYLLAALLLLVARIRGVALVTVVATTGYWLLMAYALVPGFGRSGLELGILNPMGNLASALDRLVIPREHLYHQGFYDPEGLLSTLPALATVLFGVLTAAWLRRKGETTQQKLAVLALCAGVLIVLGITWNASFPINKRLWTSSYVLLCAGIAMGLLASVAWVVDKSGWFRREWLRGSLTPWLAFGTNALTAYIFSEVLSIALGSIPLAGYGNVQRFTFELLPAWLGSPSLRSFLWSLLFTGVCFLPVLWLYRRRIFIKL